MTHIKFHSFIIEYLNLLKCINVKIKVLIIVSTWYGLNKEWDLEENKKLNIIKRIVEQYKKNGIKIVFYSKEDPVFYEKFADYAKLADYIFTTEADCIPKYKEECNNNNVYQLSFGINPIYHNPIGVGKNKCGGVIFSGSWYKNFEDRCRDSSKIFDAIIECGEYLTLIDRMWEIEDKKELGFPEKYKQYVLPKIQHKKLQNIHKMFDWAININTVKNSSTMCANRVYELQAQGNILLSNYSKAIENLFSNVFIINSKKEINNLDLLIKSITESNAQILNFKFKEITLDTVFLTLTGRSLIG